MINMKVIAPLLIIALILVSCSETKHAHEHSTELTNLQIAPDGPIKTFLTFQKNDAEEAMNFYVGLFENSKIGKVRRYGKDGPAKEGSILMATFNLNGSEFACSDSYIKHAWDFNPGVSIFVECKSESEIKKYLEKLSENGNVLMPLANYGWSTMFAFVEDRFGVSWQLNLN